MKRSRLLFPVLLFLALPLTAAPRREPDREPERRHFLLRSEHPLLQSEREELERIGCRIVREVGSLGYIVRVSPSVKTRVVEQLFVAGVETLPRREKVHSSARKQAARFGSPARVDVLFHDDVSFAEALDAVASAGGSLESPLETDFKIPRRLEVILPDSNLDLLASRDAVLHIHAPDRHITAMNRNAAALSSVNLVQAAPYDLTGAGVVVSVFDFGDEGEALADVAHLEFEGRVTKNGNFPVEQHPTHVTGTIAARGTNPAARGMAPGVRIENFAASDNFDTDKDDNFSRLSIRADNNSWGFATGWSGSGDSWDWYGGVDEEEDIFFGAYSSSPVVLDQLARVHQTMIIFSAGNENNELGPTNAPFEHDHFDDDGNEVKYCYSINGSGTDCPAQCAQRCETVRHKRNGPWQTVNRAGSGKNTLAVGAVDAQKNVLFFSSTGPARDGRVKPDLVARGVNVTSTLPGNSYGPLSGTSMAAPVVTGIAALLVEQWRKTFSGADPTAEALRVLLIHGTEDLTNGPSRPGPDYASGYGLVNAKNSADTIIEDGGTGRRIRSASIAQGGTIEIPFDLAPAGTVRITLGWMDPPTLPFPAKALINDLDLRVVTPDGSTVLPFVLNPEDPGAVATRGVNNRDNLEMVVIENAAGGAYRIQVVGSAIATAGPQTFVLASSVALGPQIAPCADSFEPNNTLETAFGRLATGISLSSKTCASTDADFYRFMVDRSGPVSATVTATDTPLRVSIFANGVPVQTAEVPVGMSRLVETSAGTGVDVPITPINYALKIEPTGAIGAAGDYTFTLSFRSSPPGRARGVRR